MNPKANAAAPTVRLQLEPGGRLARLSLCAPPLNILDRDINGQIVVAINRAEKAGAKYLLIESALPAVFSAGVSIPEHQPKTVRAMLLAFHRIFRRLHQSPLITIAAVNGHCYGGGAELALGCDFILAGRDARIGFPEIKLGCLPPIACLLLPEVIGNKRAFDLVLTGRTLTGGEAHAMGLASRLLPGGKRFSRAVDDALAEITSLSSRAQALAHEALTGEDSFEKRLSRMEYLYLKRLMNTRDAREGIAAFMEKRKPRWTDE
jgi:cyclohexa-1,5-dienecarbonyl-CoA hydratase